MIKKIKGWSVEKKASKQLIVKALYLDLEDRKLTISDQTNIHWSPIAGVFIISQHWNNVMIINCVKGGYNNAKTERHHWM